MRDYHIYTHYLRNKNVSETSPKNQSIASEKVSVEKQETGQASERQIFKPMTPKAVAAVSMAAAHKINSYVGELTENRITQRRVQVGLTMASLGLLALKNPIVGGIALAGYVGNSAIQYQIRIYKENLSADYMRQLSNGTVRVGR